MNGHSREKGTKLNFKRVGKFNSCGTRKPRQSLHGIDTALRITLTNTQGHFHHNRGVNHSLPILCNSWGLLSVGPQGRCFTRVDNASPAFRRPYWTTIDCCPPTALPVSTGNTLWSWSSYSTRKLCFPYQPFWRCIMC